MLDYIQKFNINHERIYLIFGTRKKDDIICYEEILSIQKNMDNLDYIPVLSREEWDGATGYVHTHYKTLVETKDLKDPIFYLCGWRGMILEARDNLKEYGYDSEKIICEIYD